MQVRVVELQAYCKKHKIVTKAKKKADLLEVVSSHLAGGGENVVKKEEDD